MTQPPERKVKHYVDVIARKDDPVLVQEYRVRVIGHVTRLYLERDKSLPGVPPAVLTDCALRAKYASPQRPWPYSSPEDALACFQKVAAEGQKKYAGIAISIEKEVILRLEKRG